MDEDLEAVIEHRNGEGGGVWSREPWPALIESLLRQVGTAGETISGPDLFRVLAAKANRGACPHLPAGLGSFRKHLSTNGGEAWDHVKTPR